MSRRKYLIQKSSNIISACIAVTFLVQLIYLRVIKNIACDKEDSFCLFLSVSITLIFFSFSFSFMCGKMRVFVEKLFIKLKSCLSIKLLS